MRAVVQRVSKARVEVDNDIIGKINKGLLVFLGVGKDDEISDLDYMVNKILGLRIFEDQNNKMNLSIKDIGGEILIVSQFTLYGDVRKGRRPNFMDSADPKKALDYYKKFIEKIRAKNIQVESGEFAANMDIFLINDGPVTILLDSKKNF